MLTTEELKNLTVLVEVGAKALSADKPLQESAGIQNTAIALLKKLQETHEEPKVE